jgi:alpha-mannosidase
MSLTQEWVNRITHWDSTLWQICYEPLETLELIGFVTRENFTAEQASNQKFHPMPIGTVWGTKWQYGWFKTEFSLPKTAAGKRIVLYMNPAAKSPDNGECLVWSNGKIIGSFGWARREITLTKNGIPGDRFSILAEAYAGHGPLVIGGGPIRFGQESVPEVKEPQVKVGESSFGIWREQVYQLAFDFTTLFELRNRLDPSSLRVSEIDQGLKDVTLLIDLELPELEILDSINQCRERLRPLLDCVNGSTAPTLFAFGHGHIDVAWLWPLAETERKIVRTVINQLALIEEYPDYRFLQSQPQLYTMLKSRYPELYDRLKQAVSAGKVIADGAMWVEADTNLSGGESLIRQIMYAKQFFQQEFSINSEVLWLPDVFGYSGSLPQILVNCGCTSFATQKIAWTYNGGDQFPYNTFLWEGIDGTTIPTHIFTDYNSQTRPASLLDRWEARLQSDGIHSLMLSFGWGDGGGGPTRDHLEFLSRAKDLEGLPKVKLASPAEFFEDLKQKGLPKERYVGELYYQAHRGTYTSQAKIKLGNRQSEFSLREAEFWGSIARTLNDYVFTQNTLKSSWLKLLLNQFHDILPGSSIHRVYEEAAVAFEEVFSSATVIAQVAASTFTSKVDSYTVFNSLSWERTVLIDFPHGPALVTVPPCGWTSVDNNQLAEKAVDNHMLDNPVTKNSLENDILRAIFNNSGEMISLVDKDTGIEMLAGVGNRFCLYKDIPSSFDAWDIDSMTENLLMQTDEPVRLEVVQSNPYISKIKLVRKIHLSSITQLISLQKGSHRIDFETTIDWQESHKLLKVAFPVNIHTDEAIHEIQFGYIKRPNHRSRPFDTDRFEVCNHKWSAVIEENRGVAILNNCKYGINVLGNKMNLTLLKSSLAPDPIADKGIQTFTYAIYYWTGSFSDCDVVHEAYELNYSVMIRPGAAEETSIFNLDAPNIILETIKPAEDGSKDIILRLYESKHSFTHCTLSTTLPVLKVSQTDMLEKFENEVPLDKRKIVIDFRPFEIKTLRLSFDK